MRFVVVEVPDTMLSVEMLAVVAEYRRRTRAMEMANGWAPMRQCFVLPVSGDDEEDAFTKAGMLAATVWDVSVAPFDERTMQALNEHVYLLGEWPRGRESEVVNRPDGPRELVNLDLLADQNGCPRESILAIPPGAFERWGISEQEVHDFLARKAAEEAAWEQLPSQWFAFLAYDEAMGHHPSVQALMTPNGPQVFADGPTTQRFLDWIGGMRAQRLKADIAAIDAKHGTTSADE